ncbi:MAG: DUF2070 family protein [Ignisphaera sp.]
MLDEKALKYYRALRIPSSLSRPSKYLYALVLMVLILIYVLLWYTDRLNINEMVSVSIIHTMLITFLPLYVKLLISYTRTRQAINIAFFLLVPGVPLELLGALVRIYGLVYIVIPLLGVIVLRSFTGSRYKSYTTIIYALIAELLFMIFVDRFTFYRIVVRLILLVSPIAISLYFVKIISSSYRELDIFKIANAWIKSMLLNTDEDFSSILNFVGQESNIVTHTVLFKTKSKTIAYLVPEIHFGPFRNVGSSAVPHMFDQLTRNTNIVPLVFHGAGSHERNIVSSNESERYVKEIVNRLNSMNEFTEDILYKPFRVHDNHFEAFVFQTNIASFIAISTPIVGNDDIPFEVQLRALELGKIYGLRDVAIIDCHNVKGTPIENSNAYENIILSSLSRSTGICKGLGVGYGEAYVKGYVGGLCSNKVKVLTIRCEDSLYAIIYLYGNNALIGVREALKKLAMDMGYTDAEIFTADDHTCSGITFREPYQAIELNLHLVKAVESALKMSLSSIEDATVYSSKIVVKSKIVGQKIFELLELAKLISQKIVKYLLASFSLVYILTLTLCLTTVLFS